MKVTVLMFARARDLAGTDRVEMDLPAGATVGTLRRELAENWPKLAGLLEKSALAVGGEFAGDAVILQPNVEIAVLPPVSGG